MKIAVNSHKGQIREKNEDAYGVIEKQNIYIIADGVGGSNAGEIASSTAVSEIIAFMEKKSIKGLKDDNEIGNHLKACIEETNNRVFQESKAKKSNSGMATTLLMCHIRDNKAYFANVGDSRAYVFRQNEMFQLTEDHTYVNTLLKMGMITPKEAEGHQKSHIITRAMGAENSVEADFYQTNLIEGDVVLMCTDGLYGELLEGEICQIIRNSKGNIEEMVKKLVEDANIAGGRDNITVLCIEVDGGINE